MNPTTVLVAVVAISICKSAQTFKLWQAASDQLQATPSDEILPQQPPSDWATSTGAGPSTPSISIPSDTPLPPPASGISSPPAVDDKSSTSPSNQPSSPPNNETSLPPVSEGWSPSPPALPTDKTSSPPPSEAPSVVLVNDNTSLLSPTSLPPSDQPSSTSTPGDESLSPSTLPPLLKESLLLPVHANDRLVSQDAGSNESTESLKCDESSHKLPKDDNSSSRLQMKYHDKENLSNGTANSYGHRPMSLDRPDYL